LGLGFYFSRIERFHAERVPLEGPVVFASNHPNSLADAFVMGSSVPRKVNFVATVQLFQLKAVRWLLGQCGVIAINRVKDDPRGMRSVLATFEACFRVLERGEAIGIFPEGVTHSDPQLKTVKTGTARMTLELEHRHGGRLGLRIVPVGLTFSAKEVYRSEVLVHFGEPIRVAEFLAGYPERKHECVQALNGELERRIQALILHLPRLERSRVVEAVKRLYLDRLRVGDRVIHDLASPRAEELLLTQRIASAVDHVFGQRPDVAAGFVRRLDHYERWLQRLRLAEADLNSLDRNGAWGTLLCAAAALLFLPLAVYGWVHRVLPYAFVRWTVARHARTPSDETQVTTATILSGAIAFGVFYSLCVAVFFQFFGWPAAFWYALSLPAASLVAHYYWRELRSLTSRVRASVVILRAPLAARGLAGMRAGLVARIESARDEIERERNRSQGRPAS
jgi:1-acyl-sn-glycerol-3-phosphate acyltransferase